MSVYEVAFHLKKTVTELKTIPYEELLGWFNYFERRPVDWRDDDRTAKLLQAQGVKADPKNLFPSLQAVHSKPANDGFDANNFKKSQMFSMLMQSVNGDKLDLN